MNNFLLQILFNERCCFGRPECEPLNATSGNGAAQLTWPDDPVPNNERLPGGGRPPAGPRGRLHHQPQHHEPGADPDADGRDAGAVPRPNGGCRRPAEHGLRHVRIH